MPFRTFALIVIGVIAASAASVWAMAAIAIRFQVQPFPAFIVLGVLALVASFIVRKLNG